MDNPTSDKSHEEFAPIQVFKLALFKPLCKNRSVQISLDGAWQLYFFPQGEHEYDSPQGLVQSGIKPIPAQVPGNVELDLQRAGLLPDLYYSDNIRQVRRFETYEWWYFRSFPVPAEFLGKRVEIAFEGMDNFGT